LTIQDSALLQIRQARLRHLGMPSDTSYGQRDHIAEEIAFAASLCTHPADTLIAVHRSHEEGEIREAFRTLRPRAGAQPLRAFSFLEVEEAGEPGETVDLAKLAQEKK
jgi:hypothetical protein